MRPDDAVAAADPAPLPNLDDAAQFLDCLGAGESWTFQTFDDNPARKLRNLSRILHGTLAEHADTVVHLQDHGAGAFVMVNQGDGRGRKTENVTAVRAAFLDLDGAPLQPVIDSPLQPHVIVETSHKRYHAYWRVSDCPLDRFEQMQRRLIARFQGDAKVKDLPRVMRLPGFLHLKGQPFQSRILQLLDDRPAYKLAELELAFPLDRQQQAQGKRNTDRNVIPEGERNNTLLSLGATWRNAGISRDGVLQRIRTVNRDRCARPLSDSEVCAILESVFRYRSEHGIMLSSVELEALREAPPQAYKVYIAAKMQHTAGNDHVSLTLKDMKAHGFHDSETLASAIKSARSVGLLQVHRAATYKQRGTRPQCALYALPLSGKTG